MKDRLVPEKPALAATGTFHFTVNNNVTAVVTSEIWQMTCIINQFRTTKRGRHLKDPQNCTIVPGPIFTFSDMLGSRGFVTGDVALYLSVRTFFEQRGYEFIFQDSGLYVPFSQAREKNPKAQITHTIETSYRTNVSQFNRAFPGFKLYPR